MALQAGVLQVTAVVPVRGRILAMPALGSLHQLKQIAALLEQGMINIQISEEMTLAYYSNWILGKMMTSARQLSFTSGSEDLIPGLLRHSAEVMHSYRQVPEEVLLRWELENIPAYLTSENWETNIVIYKTQRA
ncbi:hypothetical protein [Paenibacillus lentus]|uniref:hypothetical protein n=1 Tax=Paenibacillus lentus TaxID=1338368 RepID=UPI0013DE3F82|nr:hypothetical protein [Paenibacillus lentus]